MRKSIYIWGIILIISLTGCSNKKSNIENLSITQSDSETIQLDIIVNSSESKDDPFEIVMDRILLENGIEDTAVCNIVTTIDDWSYRVTAQKGEIKNKEDTSFEYTKPKDDSQNDTIEIVLVDESIAKTYTISIPLNFINVLDNP